MAKKTTKRELSPEEVGMAAMIKAAIAAIPGMTEESLGIELKVSQGMVSHWTGARSAVSLKRAPALAAALHISDPSKISVAYREFTGTSDASKGGRQESHPVKLDPEKIKGVHEMLRELYRNKGWVYSIEAEPERFARAYALSERLPKGQTLRDLIELSEVLDVISPQGAKKNGRSKQVPAQGTPGRRMARTRSKT